MRRKLYLAGVENTKSPFFYTIHLTAPTRVLVRQCCSLSVLLVNQTDFWMQDSRLLTFRMLCCGIRSWIPGSPFLDKKSKRTRALCYVVPTAPAHEVMNLDPPACIHQGSRGPLKTLPTVDYALSRRVLLGMMPLLFSSNDQQVIPRQRAACYETVEGGLQMEPACSYEKENFCSLLGRSFKHRRPWCLQWACPMATPAGLREKQMSSSAIMASWKATVEVGPVHIQAHKSLAQSCV
ncbi:hypothetical protein J3F84DRAFT_121946 [Trichoderma pleuroticola]